MKLKDILNNLEIMGGTADGELQISGVDCDSRRIEQGFVFVAVRGYDADGHAFISAAAEKGAAAVICEEPPAIDIPYVLVKDSRYALAIASRDFYGDPASKMTVIAVTGTCGKTTSTYLIKHLLEAAAGAKVGLVGTNGNMIGEKLIHTERTTPESTKVTPKNRNEPMAMWFRWRAVSMASLPGGRNQPIM